METYFDPLDIERIDDEADYKHMLEGTKYHRFRCRKCNYIWTEQCLGQDLFCPRCNMYPIHPSDPPVYTESEPLTRDEFLELADFLEEISPDEFWFK
jgi:hypothetical protein